MDNSANRSRSLCSSALETIGHTPLIALDRFTRGVDGRILAKAEMFNPGLSKKDRAALAIIEHAEKDGRLTPGQTVVELTSGNMGSGLAVVCAIKGHPFVAVISRGNSPERAAMVRMLGAEVVLVDQADGRPGEVTGKDLARVEETAQRIAADRAAFRADQFHNAANRMAHETGTALEIWQQCGGRIDAFCDFVGSGGTFGGCARFFRDSDPSIRCFLVEPCEAAVYGGMAKSETKPHGIQGGGYADPALALMNDVEPEGVIAVSTVEAEQAMMDLARSEGLVTGYSSGANLVAARRILEEHCPGGTVVTVLNDSGLKYMQRISALFPPG